MRRASSGALLLVLPVLAFVLAVLHLLRAAPDLRRPLPALPAPAESVAALTGALELDGRVLAVRVAPLRAGAEREGFEAEALRARLAELSEGEPWRLDLAGASGLVPIARARVEDREGLALRPLADELDVPPEAAEGPVDPLRVLLGGSRAGEGSALVLWGRRPEEGARLVVAGPWGETAAELAAEDVAVSDLPGWIARLAGEGDEGERQ